MADVNIKINLITKQAAATLTKFNQQIKRAQDNLNNFGKTGKDSTDKVSNGFKRVSTIAKGILASQVINKIFSSATQAIGAAFQNIISFEKALIGVAKTTNLTANGLEKLGKSLTKLSTELPVNRDELARIAELAGQLGVRGASNLTKFTKTIAQLTVSTDLTAESASKALARLLNLTEEPIDNIDRLASAIVEVGNNVEATESEITSLASEIGRATAGFEVSSQDIIGLSGALKSVGAPAESAGTAIGKVFREIDTAILKGGETLEEFARISGVSTEELKKNFQKNAFATFVQFIKGAKRLEQSGEQITSILDSIGLNTDRVSKNLRPLINRADLLTESLNLSTTAFEENSAAQEEAARTTESLDGKWRLFTARLQKDVERALIPATEAIKALLDASNRRGVLDDLFDVDTSNLGLDEAIAQVEATKKAVAELPPGIKAAFDEIKATDATVTLGPLQQERKKFLELIKFVESERQKSRDSDEQENLRQLNRIQAGVNATVDGEKQKRVAKAETIKANADLELDARLAETELALQEAGLDEDRRAIALASFKNNELKKLEAKRLNRLKDLGDEQKYQDELAKVRGSQAKRETELNEKVGDFKDKTRKEEERTVKSSLNIISSLQQSQSKELFAIGKAAAIANAIINTQEAATSALKVQPPPLGFALAAAVTAAGLARVSQIASQQPKFRDGGIVGGNSFSGDSITARVNSGEMILNREQQAQLFEQANGARSEEPKEVIVNTTVELDGEVVGKSVSRQVANGLVLGEGGV